MCEELPHKQQTEGGRMQSSLRRQVSDLGMEDPVMRRAGSKKLESRESANDDSESTASTSRGEEETEEIKVTVSVGGEEEEEDGELDFEELKETMSRMSQRSRSTGTGSSVSRGSSASILRVMADSTSFNSCSFATAEDHQVSMTCWNNDDESYVESIAEESTAGTTIEKKRGSRRLPPRTGSGYVRAVRGEDVPHTNSPKTRRSLRTSILKNNKGLAVSAAAFREKRICRSRSTN